MVSKVSVSYACYFLIFTVIYRCNAHPDNLDAPGARRRTHEMTDFLIRTWDASILWTDFGIRADIVVCFLIFQSIFFSSYSTLQPFTHGFPRADIHQLLTPDLLHQVIKGTFKDHLVMWVNEYLYEAHGEARANDIVEDIDRRCVYIPCSFISN